jgi:phosphatidylinositol kinase/protein kinase (PI-3  family)
MGAQELTANIIYLMGGSFIVGSLFTILMLLILEIIRRNPPGTPPNEP